VSRQAVPAAQPTLPDVVKAIGVTLFGIFLTPVFFYVIRRKSVPPPKSEPFTSPL
jgi:hypothetical protein